MLKELEDTSPTNEAEGQNTTSGSRTESLDLTGVIPKLPQQESQAHVDVEDVDPNISSFWLHKTWFQKMSGERRSLNSNNIIPMLPTALGKGIIMAVYIQTCLKLLVVFRSSDEFTAT